MKIWLLGFIAAAIIPSLLNAQDAESLHARPVPPEVAEKALEAVFQARLDLTESNHWTFCGAFIDPDGLAVLPLEAMEFRELPDFQAADGNPLAFDKVVRADRSLEIAIVKFKHRPKRWLELAEEAAGRRSEIALLWRNGERQGAHFGPVVALRPRFWDGEKSERRFLSLGLNLGPIVDETGPVGSPVIDSSGHLAGIFVTREPIMPKYPAALLACTAKSIKGLLDSPAPDPPIAFPLPDRWRNYDEGYWAYQERVSRLAPHQGVAEEALNEATREKVKNEVLVEHPESRWIRNKVLEDQAMKCANELAELLVSRKHEAVKGPLMDAVNEEIAAIYEELIELNPDELRRLSPLTLKLSALSNQLASGGKALPEAQLDQLRREIEDQPLGPSIAQLSVFATLEEGSGNRDRAIDLYKQTLALAPDYLLCLETCGILLDRAGRFEESDRIQKEVYWLEEAYQGR